MDHANCHSYTEELFLIVEPQDFGQHNWVYALHHLSNNHCPNIQGFLEYWMVRVNQIWNYWETWSSARGDPLFRFFGLSGWRAYHLPEVKVSHSFRLADAFTICQTVQESFWKQIVWNACSLQVIHTWMPGSAFLLD